VPAYRQFQKNNGLLLFSQQMSEVNKKLNVANQILYTCAVMCNGLLLFSQQMSKEVKLS
jgi:hypothetical protein